MILADENIGQMPIHMEILGHIRKVVCVRLFFAVFSPSFQCPSNSTLHVLAVYTHCVRLALFVLACNRTCPVISCTN